MAISQKTTDALKSKYATAEELQSSAEFSKLTPEMQKTALGAYTAPITTQDKITSGELDVSQAPIEPVKSQVVPSQKVTTTTQKDIDEPTTTTTTNNVKVPEIKSTAIDPNKDDSFERLKNIQDNLQLYAQTTPNLFSDTNNYKDFFKYNERSDTQKKLLDNYYNQYKYNNLFNGKSSQSIGDMIINGTISQGDLQTLSTTNPTLYSEVQSYVQKNSEYENANSAITNKSKIETIAETIGVEMPTEVDLATKYTELHNTPEIQEASKQVTTIYSEIQTLDQQIADMKETIEKAYEGTGASRDEIDAIVADKQEALSRERTRKYIAYQAVSADYNAKKTNADNQYNAYKDQVTLNRQQWQDALSTLGFYYESTPQGMSEMASAKYEAQYPNMDSAKTEQQKDMALNQALETYYKDFGIIIQRPQSQVVSEIKKYAKDKGISLSQALKENFVIPLQGKSEYKQILNQSLGISNKPVEIGGQLWQQDSSGNWGKVLTSNNIDLMYMSGLGDLSTSSLVSQYPNEASFKNNNPTGIKMSASDALKKMWTDAGISFGEGTTSPEGGKYIKFATMEDGLKAYQIALTQRGDDIYSRLKQWKGVGDTEGYANQVMAEAGIEKGEKFSSLSPEKLNKLMNSHLKRESGGLYNYLQSKGGLSSSGTGYDENLSRVFEAMSQNKGKIDSTTQKALKDLGIDATQIGSQYNAWKKGLEAEIKPQAQSLLNNIDKLKNIDVDQYTGMALNLPYTEGRALKRELEQMTSSMAMQKLIELKSQGATFGALSNEELKFIEDAAGGKKFGTDLLYKDWKANILEFERILRKLDTTVGLNNVILNTTQDYNQGQGTVLNTSYFDFGNLFTLTQ